MLTHIDRNRMEAQIRKLSEQKEAIDRKIADIQRLLDRDFNVKNKKEKS